MLIDIILVKILEEKMAITIKDVIKLYSLQGFRLLAGESGLNKLVTVAGILDHEFLDNDKPFKVEAFDKNSFVISSLLFANGNKNLILPAIEGLFRAGVSGFAFKTVIYDKVPQEVLEYAEQHEFPIFSFNDVEFENIIFEIMDAVKNDDNMLIIEKNIEKMIEHNLTRSEITILAKGMSSSFKQNAKIAYVSNVRMDKMTIQEMILRRFYANEELSTKAMMCRFKDDLIIIITMSGMYQNKFDIIFEEITSYCGLNKNVIVGFSDTHPSYEGMDYCLKEGYYASIVGKIEEKNKVNYKKIGTYQMLLPKKNSDEQIAYMFRYLEPILNQEEQFKTAIQYILAAGDINETAKRLICHKNTVRYRINKLHEILDYEVSDLVFYENLSTAIKIYLIKHI